ALRKALKANDVADPTLAKKIRVGVLEAFYRIGPGAEAAVPDITAILEDESRDSDERRSAASAVGAIGPAAKTAIPALTKALQGTDAALSQTSRQVLDQMQR